MVARGTSQRGFTLAELLIALTVFIVMSASSLALYGSATPAIRVNGQVNRLITLLQRGREAAVVKQRNHEIRFDAETSIIDLIRREGDDEVLVEQMAFEHGVRLIQFVGSPDTPDAYGNAAVVDFGNAEELLFTSEGSLVDESALPINGTVFLGIEDNPTTARAVTVTGATGRAQFYVRAQGGSWQNGWLAK